MVRELPAWENTAGGRACKLALHIPQPCDSSPHHCPCLTLPHAAWAEHVQRKRAAAVLVQRALGGRAERSLGACFALWRSAASASRRRKQLLQQALGRLVQQRTSQAFARWRETAACKGRQRQVVASCVAKLTGRCTTSCFDGWRQWAAARRRRAGIATAAVADLHRRQLAACVGEWRAAAHRAAAAKRCLAAMRLRSMHTAWVTWVQAAEDARAKAANAALAPQALRRRFAAWRGAAQLVQQKRQRVEKAAAWAFGTSRQRAWRAWRLYLSHRRAKRAAQQHFASGVLRRCLGAWAERVARRQRLLVKQGHLEEQAARRRLAAVLLTWRRVVRARAFTRRYYCARALATWAEKAAEAKVGGM